MSELGSTGGSKLRFERQAAERVARELMDMKIETAHLRERLRLRVGGDITAAELEAEAFALQTALGEAQKMLKVREAELQSAEVKYQKAMRGLMQMDEAWKVSIEQTKEAQDAKQKAERCLTEERLRCNGLQRDLELSNQKELALLSKYDVLMDEVELMRQQRDERAQEAKANELQIHELTAQLDTARHQFETKIKKFEGASRGDVRRLQEDLQKAEEQAAALRGEIHARQEEADKVEAELRDAKLAEVSIKQRLVKLTEDNGRLRVHEKTARVAAAESTRRATQSESENERIKMELDDQEGVLKTRNQIICSLEKELVQKQRILEEELAKNKKNVEDVEERLKKESQEMLQMQEETWRCRERMFQKDVEDYKQKHERLRAFHIELAELLKSKDSIESSSNERMESVEPAMLKALIVQNINKCDVFATTLTQMKRKIGLTKRRLSSQKHLEVENTKLRAEYEKAKLAMERMATRKSKTSVNLPVQVQSYYVSSGGQTDRRAKETDTPLIKRQLEADAGVSIELKTPPRKTQRTKHVFVASRYLSSATKR
ncbi:hypothetical protein CCR75_007380 [Bremia lactucae]|uniref:Uncharacterized protein n=1 Tax=Bremia lactucae TaxID=4779 RepID=A0A976FFZ4_BRELC|nr:hypothetical protein CCR75_007380 [Bremia lactucae]